MDYEEPAARQALEPGKRYRIVLEDCCIQGELQGTFLERVPHEEDSKVYETSYRFDIGVIGPCWGLWRTEEVDESD